MIQKTFEGASKLNRRSYSVLVRVEFYLFTSSSFWVRVSAEKFPKEGWERKKDQKIAKKTEK